MVGHKHGFPRYTGPNGATLSFERQAVNSDWAAAHWLQSDVWTILEGGHHRFALRSPGGSKPPTQSGWEARTDVGAQLPIDLWTPVAQGAEARCRDEGRPPVRSAEDGRGAA